MRRLKWLAFLFVGLVWVLQGCTYKLSLNGASIPAALKTIRVEFFENTSPLVVNTLSQQFTEALKDRIRNQTSLSVVNGEAQAVMSGTITDYNIAPVSVQATNSTTAPIADQTRLTITVHVIYTYDADKKLSFEQSFTKYKDFKGELSTVEQSLITDINKQLTEDIFNQAFANWD